MSTTRKSSRRAARSGQAIVIVALGMIGLLAFTVLAIDGARFYSQRRAAQNASDMSALAGLYAYVKAPNPAALTEHDMLATVNHTAELNEIADPDGTPGDAINANVTVWWLDKDGNLLNGGAPMQDSTSNYAPAGTNAIMVQTRIPYETFIGGLIGQPRLVAQADSTARINVNYKTYTDNTNSMFTIGGDCNNLTTRIAHNYATTNTSKFLSGVYIGGSLGVGAVNSSDFYGDVQVATITGTGPIGGPYTDVGTGNPFEPPLGSNSNQFHNSKVYKPPVTVPEPYPEWTQQYGHTLDAADFAAPDGAYYQNLSMYQIRDPLLVYVAVAGGPGADDRVHDAFVANPGKHLLVYVDGDLSVDDYHREWNGTVTLIVKGRFDNSVSGNQFGSAGPIAGNISILAGYNPGGDNRCASNPSTWVFHAQGNNSQYFGIVYVPYGQIFFDGNTSGGTEFSKAVVTYSVYLYGNSWQFNFDPSVFQFPVPTTELNK